MSMYFCSFVERKNKHLGTGFANLNVNKILVYLKGKKEKKRKKESVFISYLRLVHTREAP